MSELQPIPLSDSPMLAEYYQRRFDELQAAFMAAKTQEQADLIALNLTPIANWLALQESKK
ncbi:MAG: hypothetical protein ACFNXU_00940 [Kingella sp. (in: b-proteobacteria)]|jgi:hypothetical protein